VKKKSIFALCSEEPIIMASAHRSCTNDPDVFCYICGEYTMKECRKPITEFVRKVYFAYFNTHIKNQDKAWVPHSVCKTCTETLRYWSQGTRKGLNFGVPMVWKEQQNHFDDCYFCLVNITGINRKMRSKLTYPNLPSATRPQPQSDIVPIPTASCLTDISEGGNKSSHSDCDSDRDRDCNSDCDVSSDDPRTPPSPTLFSQNDLSDMIRELNLSKKSSELLASRLKERHMLSQDTKITFYRHREKNLLPFFTCENKLVHCHDIVGLLKAMGLNEYQSNDWRLFIDSSKRSLKCVLLHNGNKYGSIPLAHSTAMKEEHQTISLVLEKIKYQEHQWIICVDLKMVNILLGQQHGYTKYPCFICFWDSRAKLEHWVKKDWPLRTELVVGQKNVINKQLVSRNKIILPPLHIKLGLMKQFVKALNKDGACFEYISRKFPGLSTEKLKAGVFDGPQIRQLLKDTNFTDSMNLIELPAWTSFVDVITNFLGNHKAQNYITLVNHMLAHFKKLGCNMSIKVHYLHSHLDCFPENLGDLSDEQGERFHQDLKTMEDRYQGRWDTHMMADYCWSLMRDSPGTTYSRRSLKRGFLYVQ
jgi:hypothetical protein